MNPWPPRMCNSLRVNSIRAGTSSPASTSLGKRIAEVFSHDLVLLFAGADGGAGNGAIRMSDGCALSFLFLFHIFRSASVLSIPCVIQRTVGLSGLSHWRGTYLSSCDDKGGRGVLWNIHVRWYVVVEFLVFVVIGLKGSGGASETWWTRLGR